MTREVKSFFERSAESYLAQPGGMAPFHRVAAARIEGEVHGNVLAIGGLWAQATPERLKFRATLTDLSLPMLLGSGIARDHRVVSDGQTPPFRRGSFDHVVLPLVLHHVTGMTFSSAQEGAATVIDVVRLLLRRGGTLWISEFCTSPAVYRLQRWLAPLTRRVLQALGEPLVVMHSDGFYRGALLRSGWEGIRVEPISADDSGRRDWVRPIIAAPWLRVPRFCYPLHPTLIRATAP